MTGRVLSVQVGLPRTMDPQGKAWTTATFKNPVAGPIQLSREGLAGDGHADLVNHGGVDKAVLAYSAAHGAEWAREGFPEGALPGALGENLTVDGLTEADVCLGDVYDLGSARVEVSQPRQPCWKQSQRYGRPDLVARIVQTGRTGWYLRVLREGTVEADDVMTLVARPHPEWTVSRANRVMHFEKTNREMMAELVGCPALAEAWKRSLRKRIEG